MTDAEKEKQKLHMNAVVSRILKDFVGREITPLIAAEAEGRVRETLVGLILSGDYVLPAGLELSHVSLSDDMKILVFFKRAPVS